MANVCLITGGARGIGRETARLAAAGGWDVAINFRERSDAAEALVVAISAAGRKAIAVRGDVAEESDVVAMFEAAERALGPITGLVNSAGVSFNNRVDAIKAHELERMFAVNVIGLMLCCREAAKRMSTARRRQGWRYRQCLVDGGHHRRAARRLGLRGEQGRRRRLHHGLCQGGGGRGGARQRGASGCHRHRHDRAHAARGPVRAEIEATIPMQRYGDPDEVAQAIVWLLSDKASYVTGAHLNVGGGGFHVGAPVG